MAKTDPLEDQIAQLRADMARIAATLAGLGQTAGDTLRSTLAGSDTAEMLGAAEKAAEKIDAARETASATLADVTDYARANPVQALAMAGGLGLLLGLMFGRR